MSHAYTLQDFCILLFCFYLSWCALVSWMDMVWIWMLFESIISLRLQSLLHIPLSQEEVGSFYKHHWGREEGWGTWMEKMVYKMRVLPKWLVLHVTCDINDVIHTYVDSRGTIQQDWIDSNIWGWTVENTTHEKGMNLSRSLPAEETGSGSSSVCVSVQYLTWAVDAAWSRLYTTCILSAEYALGIPTVYTLHTTWMRDLTY